MALAWAALFLVPFAVAYGPGETGVQLAETLVLDYVPFIVLLLGLFTVSGGIHVKGTIAGTTKNNVILLALGTFLASWVGTTGAAMLLVRPVLRANAWRRNKTHVVVFFIFLVAASMSETSVISPNPRRRNTSAEVFGMNGAM